jgi:hypothetical protein
MAWPENKTVCAYMAYDSTCTKDMALNAVYCFLRQTWTNKELIVLNATKNCLDLEKLSSDCLHEIKVGDGPLGNIKNLALDMLDKEWSMPWPYGFWYAPDYISYHMQYAVNSVTSIKSTPTHIEIEDEDTVNFAFLTSALGLIRYDATGDEQKFIAKFRGTHVFVRDKARCFKQFGQVKAQCVKPPEDIMLTTKCYLLLGRYGDILNALPIFKHLYDVSKVKPNVIISKEFSDAANWVTYWNTEIYDGAFDLTLPAVKKLSSRWKEIVVMQPCTRDFYMDCKCTSFSEEVWQSQGLLYLRDKLPLLIDNRCKRREIEVIEKYIQYKKKNILIAADGKSSPYPYRDTLIKCVNDYAVANKDTVNVVDLSKVKLFTLIDALGLLDAASVIVTIDTAYLHLARAADLPVIAYTNNKYGTWSSTVPTCNIAKQFGYADSFSAIDLNAALDVLLKLPIKVVTQTSVSLIPTDDNESIVICLANGVKLTSDCQETIRRCLCTYEAVYALCDEVIADKVYTSNELAKHSYSSLSVGVIAFTSKWLDKNRYRFENVCLEQCVPVLEALNSYRINDIAYKDAISSRSDSKPYPIAVYGHRHKQPRDVDQILNYYKRAKNYTEKRTPYDFSAYALTNCCPGIGDMMLLTPMPRIATEQGKYVYICHDNLLFSTLMKYNCYYRDPGKLPTIAAPLLQRTFKLGNGHLMQRLQRAWNLSPDICPKGYLNYPVEKIKGKCAIHLEPGKHVTAQNHLIHNRARCLYPQNIEIIQQFILRHTNDMSFVELGGSSHSLEGVADGTHYSLDDTIKELATCEFFIGINSGPMHIAAALDVKCVVILNFPSAHEIFLPVLTDIDLIDIEWLYPQAVHLHQDSDGPLAKIFSLRNLELALDGGIYPYWSKDYLDLINVKL